MAYTHIQVAVDGDTAVPLTTLLGPTYIQNNSPSTLRVKIGSNPVNTPVPDGIRVLPNSTLPLPIGGETPAGIMNGILEQPGAGTVNIDILEDA